MKISNTVTYTIPAGPGTQPNRYEQSAILIHDRKLTVLGAERILNKRLGVKPGADRAQRVIVTRIEAAGVAN